ENETESIYNFLLKLSGQDKILNINSVFTQWKDTNIRMIASGSRAHIFEVEKENEVIKLIPIDEEVHRNVVLTHLKDVKNEVIIAKELTKLARSGNYSGFSCKNFSILKRFYVVKGMTPESLANAWLENEVEKMSFVFNYFAVSESQIWILLIFEKCGSRFSHNEIPCFHTRQSIFEQLCLAIATAEKTLKFEHRDLHLSNLLIDESWNCNVNQLPPSIKLNKITYHPCPGPKLTIIDFGFSRISFHGKASYKNMRGLLKATRKRYGRKNPYQLMRCLLNDNWQVYEPKTNVIWLMYQALKLFPDDEFAYLNQCDRQDVTESTKSFASLVIKVLRKSASAAHFIELAKGEIPELFSFKPNVHDHHKRKLSFKAFRKMYLLRSAVQEFRNCNFSNLLKFYLFFLLISFIIATICTLFGVYPTVPL
ncbi:unnamed protein product, partial [Hymenolepis diminuta]